MLLLIVGETWLSMAEDDTAIWEGDELPRQPRRVPCEVIVHLSYEIRHSALGLKEDSFNSRFGASPTLEFVRRSGFRCSLPPAQSFDGVARFITVNQLRTCLTEPDTVVYCCTGSRVEARVVARSPGRSCCDVRSYPNIHGTVSVFLRAARGLPAAWVRAAEAHPLGESVLDGRRELVSRHKDSNPPHVFALHPRAHQLTAPSAVTFVRVRWKRLLDMRRLR